MTNVEHDTRVIRTVRSRPNYVGGAASVVWLVFIALPIFTMVKYSLQSQSDYLRESPLALPRSPTFDNYTTALASGFGVSLRNTIWVTLASVGLVLALSVPISYAIVRSSSRLISGAFRAFLFGLAIPAQAVIIPVYLLIVNLRLYDSLIAVVLPCVAFSLPLSVLVLVSSLRDIPREMYEAMSLDGASAWSIFWRLVVPFSRSSIATVAIVAALGAWNGFLFPLILTQSESVRVLTLSLYTFQGEFQTNVPGLMAAVVLSALPVFVLYLFARRWLVAGLVGVGGK